MKQLLLALFALTAATVAKAEEFTYYMMTTANSPQIKFTEAMVSKLRETYKIDWKQNVGCAVRNQVNKETKPIFIEFVTGQMWMSLQDGNTNCVIDLDNIRWLMISDTPYRVCVKSTSNINNFQELVAAKNIKFGYATGTIGKSLIESINKDLGSTWQPVISTNSNSILTALLANDIDASILFSVVADAQIASGNIRCFATTEKDQPNSLSKLSPKTNKKLSEWSLSIPLGVKNVSNEQFNKIAADIKTTLAKAELPKNVTIYSLQNMSENQLKEKVLDATIRLYEVTK